MPKPHGTGIRGAATKGESTPSIISAADIDRNLYHQKLCEQLLPYTTGWENFFLRENSKLKCLRESQQAKLERIAARHLAGENSRLCSHCGKKAQIIDQFSYLCPQCGNCLNYFWHEGGAK